MKNFFKTVAILTAGWSGVTGVATANSTTAQLVGDRSCAELMSKDLEEKIIFNAMTLDWDLLCNLVKEDTQLSPSAKTSFRMLQDIADPVQRDKAMKHAPYYKYIFENLYPKAATINAKIDLK